jgi:hypothetical protein
MERMGTQHDQPDRHARTMLAGEVHDRMKHLAVDLRMSLAELLAEGALLVLRYHDRAEGLPEPRLPLASNLKNPKP